MRIRTKSSSGKSRWFVAGTPVITDWASTPISEFMSEDPVSNGNRVFHSKPACLQGAHHFTTDALGYKHFIEGNGSTYPYDGLPSSILNEIPLLPLNRAKLPTSSEFGILQFLYELEDTLAMFTKKFWTELSYGSVSWGIMPFVSDVKNLFETIRKLNSDLSSIPYEDELSGSFDVVRQISGYNVALKGNYTVRLSGTADISFADDILVLYDRLGFHPDLETVWDLVPLSFVVDWFIPIGDLIDRLHDRGWITTANFTGWRSVRFEGFDAWSPYPSVIPVVPRHFYARDYLEGSLITAYTPNVPVSLKRPSFKQLFNTAYIAKLGKYF